MTAMYSGDDLLGGYDARANPTMWQTRPPTSRTSMATPRTARGGPSGPTAYAVETPRLRTPTTPETPRETPRPAESVGSRAQPEEEAREICGGVLSQMLTIFAGMRSSQRDALSAIESEIDAARDATHRTESAMGQLRADFANERDAAVAEVEERADAEGRAARARCDRALRAFADNVVAAKAAYAEEAVRSHAMFQEQHAAAIATLAAAFDARCAEVAEAHAAALQSLEEQWAERYSEARKNAVGAAEAVKMFRKRHLTETAQAYDALSATARQRASLMDRAMQLISQAQAEDPTKHIGLSTILTAAVAEDDDDAKENADIPSPSQIRASYAAKLAADRPPSAPRARQSVGAARPLGTPRR